MLPLAQSASKCFSTSFGRRPSPTAMPSTVQGLLFNKATISSSISLLSAATVGGIEGGLAMTSQGTEKSWGRLSRNSLGVARAHASAGGRDTVFNWTRVGRNLSTMAAIRLSSSHRSVRRASSTSEMGIDTPRVV